MLQAITFDAFNTLLFLDAPFERLRDNLAALGYPLPLAAATSALRREMRYYASSSPLVATPEALANLRRACAQVILDDLAEQGYPLHPPLAKEGNGGTSLTADALVPALLDSLRFVLFPEVPEVLSALAARGLRTAVVSNWDLSLLDVLRRLDVFDRFDLVLPSALAGCAKPDPALFRQAVARLGVPPGAALHVGDSYENDVLPAQEAGLHARLLLREAAPPAGVPCLRDLTEVVDLCS